MEKDFLTSLWQAEQPAFPQFDKLLHNEEVDVCVVGGGISGISTAYKLASRGFKVMLLEGDRLVSGQSCRTTGHLTYQLEEQFYKLLDFFSPEEIQGYISAHKRAIDIIKENIDYEEIKCDFTYLEAFLFNDQMKIEELYKEQAAADKCGLKLNLKATPYLKDSKLGLMFPRMAQMHPTKYLHGLVTALPGLGVKICEQTRVSKVEQIGEKSVLVHTSDNLQVRCKHAVVATDTPINDRFKIHTKQHAYRTYTIAFKSTAKQPTALVWDTEDPYHYIRTCGEYVIIGGEDHHTGQMPKEDPFVNLEQWSRDNVQNLGEVAYKWSGQVYEPIDQMAYIGRNSATEKDIFIITGCSGIGLTTGSFASELIRDLITKGSHPLEKLFDPGRLNFKRTGTYIMENVNVAAHYGDWLLKDKEEDKKLPKHCRACPHLGGLVHWNALEKTWDCPAHGSRFNTAGKVIEGPASDDLPIKES